MKKLDLEKVWQIMNRLSYEESKIGEEQDKWVSLLGHGSCYYELNFDDFLDYYSFKVKDDNIIVFNDDGVPYEDYSNDDFSYVPLCLLSFSAEEIEKWIQEKVEKHIKQEEEVKKQKEEGIKKQIELFQKQLEILQNDNRTN